MATRPAGVPVEAICVPPGQTFEPGIGVQQVTIRSIQLQNAKKNMQQEQYWIQAVNDWMINAPIDRALGLPVPPVPPAPMVITTHVVYAELDGTEVPLPEGASGMNWGWVWPTEAQKTIQ